MSSPRVDSRAQRSVGEKGAFRQLGASYIFQNSRRPVERMKRSIRADFQSYRRRCANQFWRIALRQRREPAASVTGFLPW